MVTVPGGSPTGQVANTTASDFALPVGGKASFIFATLGGSIAGEAITAPRTFQTRNVP